MKGCDRVIRGTDLIHLSVHLRNECAFVSHGCCTKSAPMTDTTIDDDITLTKGSSAVEKVEPSVAAAMTANGQSTRPSSGAGMQVDSLASSAAPGPIPSTSTGARVTQQVDCDACKVTFPTPMRYKRHCRPHHSVMANFFCNDRTSIDLTR